MDGSLECVQRLSGHFSHILLKLCCCIVILSLIVIKCVTFQYDTAISVNFT